MQPDVLTVQNVKDIDDGGKRWLGGVLGQDLKDSQQVFIMVFTPGVEPDESTRQRALADVQRTMAEAEKNLTKQGITHEEFDAAVDEAMEHVRQREP